ncbi:MAG: hypothetical protein IJI14_02605 [Anaerolineaceae bacterium]|nr:hypothetical protein [Anaerolineaceae bacterium]
MKRTENSSSLFVLSLLFFCFSEISFRRQFPFDPIFKLSEPSFVIVDDFQLRGNNIVQLRNGDVQDMRAQNIVLHFFFVSRFLIHSFFSLCFLRVPITRFLLLQG